MYWLTDPENEVDGLSGGHAIVDSPASSIPAPRMNKVIAARQAVIHHDFDENKMLEHVVNSLASDVINA